MSKSSSVFLDKEVVWCVCLYLCECDAVSLSDWSSTNALIVIVMLFNIEKQLHSMVFKVDEKVLESRSCPIKNVCNYFIPADIMLSVRLQLAVSIVCH